MSVVFFMGICISICVNLYDHFIFVLSQHFCSFMLAQVLFVHIVQQKLSVKKKIFFWGVNFVLQGMGLDTMEYKLSLYSEMVLFIGYDRRTIFF